MRLKRILLSLTAFVLALSSALPAGAEAFTIPTANTHKAKPSWWPNGAPGNYNVRDFAALNGELWCIYVNGKSSDIAIKLINGKTFEAIKDINITGVTVSGTFPLSNIRRMGNQIVACNGVSGLYLKVYRWKDKNSAPDEILSLSNFKNLQGMGVSGDMNNGKLYFLRGEDGTNTGSTTLCIFTVTNGSVNATPTTIKLPDRLKAKSRQYSICPMDDESFWLKTNECYGVHINKDGSIIEELTSDNLGANIDGIGQKHFKFNGQKLAVSTNYSAANNAKPLMCLVDYTDGVGANQKAVLPNWGDALSSAGQKDILTTGADYEISDNGNRLDVWGLDPIGGFYHAWYVHTSAPGIVQNFTATARWEGAGQKVDLKWDGDAKATSYKVFDYTAGESSAVKVYEGSETSCTLDLAIGGGKEHKYRIKGYNNDGESPQSAYANTYDVGFGAITLTGTIDPADQTSTAKLEWSAPAHGTLLEYELWKHIKKTGNDNSTSESDVLVATLPTTQTSYEIPEFQSLSSITEGEVTYSVSTSLFVRAKMVQTVTTKDGTANTVNSNTVTPTAAKAPHFTSVTTYPGRRTVALSWELANSTNFTRYELYRDGIKILSNYQSGSYIDTDLPDGTYTYVVVAYFTEGGNTYATRSTSVSATIQYREDVTSYILDTVYDYPIMTQAEWEAAGSPADACLATNNFANARTPVGGGGAPGDAFRQAQFYDGKWYLAKLTACDEYISGKYIPAGYWQATANNMDINKFKDVWMGEAYVISADNATIKTIGNADGLQSTGCKWYGLENQFIALDDDGVIIRRSTKSDLGAEGNFYRPTRYLYSYGVGETDTITYGGKSFVDMENDYFNTAEGKKRIDDYNAANPQNTLTNGKSFQYYRTHYMSAAGSIKGGTGYALLAMNKSADLYRVSFNTNGTAKNVTKFTPNLEGMVYPSGKDAGKPVDPWGSTENYAFPVAGRNGAFIQTVRGIGTWYVDAAGNYTLMYTNMADVSQCGGVTFKYNNEFFVLHNSTVRSNNPGYFRIDIAQHKNGETADNVVPSKDNLIPCVGNKLDETAQFEAGNSNGSWYGAEYNAADDCIYIYQYVPGIRFAKYRLYKRDQYPDVPPTLDITTGYNGEDKTDITRFDSKITWRRPGTDHEYGMSGTANIRVDHYEVTLRDRDNNVIKTWDNIADVADANHVFTLEHKPDYNPSAGDNSMVLNSQNYIAEIVPVYIRNGKDIIRGASNFAVNNNDYPAAIGEAKAYIYSGDGDAAGMYRVDLDFDRATAANSDEPVSYFLVEYSTDGGATFNTLNKFNLLKQGEDYHYYPVEVTTGQVPGNYKFGGSDTYKFGIDTPSEKGYALREKANPATDYKCVLYYYTKDNPSGYKYRITAVYASTNARIRKTASTNAENFTGGTTGISDATGYSLSVYPVPATTAVTVTSPEAIESVRIFSTAGAEVARVAGEKDYTQSVDVSTLAPGVYMLVVNEQAPLRIVKK